MMRDLYACHDVTPSGMFRVTEEKAKELNPQGYGIFWTVNDFGGKPRQKHNLVRINDWYVDIDKLDKGEQLRLINEAPVVPTMIVETKNGFHLYWRARECSVDNYKTVLAGIRFYFGGDRNAQDLTRVLRVPGFNHMKDPNDPYPIEVVWALDDVTYFERQMIHEFPIPNDDEKDQISPYEKKVLKLLGDDFWEKAASLDCEEALKRLSGSRYVNGEYFAFKSSGDGKLNIIVNGKSTSCWIDSKKRIGSSSKGGPTIARWLKYYNHSYKEIYRILREMFPELV